jgi:hypothetical protein
MTQKIVRRAAGLGLELLLDGIDIYGVVASVVQRHSCELDYGSHSVRTAPPW